MPFERWQSRFLALIAGTLGMCVASCADEPRPTSELSADSTQAFPVSAADTSAALQDSSRAADSLQVHSDLRRFQLRGPSGTLFVHRACPGEYCFYGQWTLAEPVRLRSGPSLDADSVGLIPAQRTVCADSGLIVVDPPGLVLIGTASSVTSEYGRPPFATGDTVLVFHYLSEGYWMVRWQDSLTVAYAHWEDRPPRGAQILRPVGNFWWVHLTDPETNLRGWILRAERVSQPPQNSTGFTVVDGGAFVELGPAAACPA